MIEAAQEKMEPPNPMEVIEGIAQPSEVGNHSEIATATTAKDNQDQSHTGERFIVLDTRLDVPLLIFGDR